MPRVCVVPITIWSLVGVPCILPEYKYLRFCSFWLPLFDSGVYSLLLVVPYTNYDGRERQRQSEMVFSSSAQGIKKNTLRSKLIEAAVFYHLAEGGLWGSRYCLDSLEIPPGERVQL